jgi:hypothetical protein
VARMAPASNDNQRKDLFKANPYRQQHVLRCMPRKAAFTHFGNCPLTLYAAVSLMPLAAPRLLTCAAALTAASALMMPGSLSQGVYWGRVYCCPPPAVDVVVMAGVGPQAICGQSQPLQVVLVGCCRASCHLYWTSWTQCLTRQSVRLAWYAWHACQESCHCSCHDPWLHPLCSCCPQDTCHFASWCGGTKLLPVRSVTPG